MSIIDKSHSKLGSSGGNTLDVLTDERKVCKKLSLRRNYINDADLILKDFTALTWLCLSANAFTKFPGCLSSMPCLKHLYISNNKIKIIEHLEECFNLETLEIRHNQLIEISGISHLNKLSSLSVSGNCITELNPHALPDHLEFIGLFGNRLSDIQQVTSVFSNMKCLKKVFIGANSFCNSLPLKESFDISVKYPYVSNCVKRPKLDDESLDLSKLLALLKNKCPSLVNIDNNMVGL